MFWKKEKETPHSLDIPSEKQPDFQQLIELSTRDTPDHELFSKQILSKIASFHIFGSETDTVIIKPRVGLLKEAQNNLEINQNMPLISVNRHSLNTLMPITVELLAKLEKSLADLQRRSH